MTESAQQVKQDDVKKLARKSDVTFIFALLTNLELSGTRILEVHEIIHYISYLFTIYITRKESKIKNLWKSLFTIALKI